MKATEISLQLRNYQIDRVVNKIMNWKPKCNREGVRELLNYTHTNLLIFTSSFGETEVRSFYMEGSLKYCISVLQLSYDIDFTDKQIKWIQLEMLECLENMVKNIFENNKNRL